MMKLSTMWKVLKTVDEQWSCPLAEEILQRWRYDAGTVRFFRASANFVCVFRMDGRRHFLRFNTAEERAPGAVDAEVRLVDWLRRNGVRVAAPVPSENGHLVETVETGLGVVHAVVFAGLDGDHREIADCGPAEFRDWGRALGRLHSATKEYTDPSLEARPDWRDHLNFARAFIGEEEYALLQEWQRLFDWAGGLPKGADDFGLIHFDFESDNLCWQDQQASILDFDDCARYWYMADIAYALRDLLAEGVDPDHPKFQAFVDGYAECHPVNQELLGQIPMFLRLHEMYLFGRLSRALDLKLNDEIPQWLQRLNAKLAERVSAYRNRVLT